MYIITYSQPLSCPIDIVLQDETENEIIWKDPNTGEIFVVNKRTGNSYPRGHLAPGLVDDISAIKPQRRTLLGHTRVQELKVPSLRQEGKPPMPEWIQHALGVCNSS